MASQPCCDAGPAVGMTYDKKGNTIEHEGITVYRVGTGPLGLVLISDIFGYGTNQVRPAVLLDACLQIEHAIFVSSKCCQCSNSSGVGAF